MTNEYAKAELANVLEEVQQQFRSIAATQQARAELTASATVRKRVTVTVNADGTIIDTKFHSGIEELTYGDIAKAVTAAAQQAAQEVGRKAQELMAPVLERQARLPKLTDMIEGLADLNAAKPVAPPATMVVPDTGHDADGSVQVFHDVEAYTPNRDRGVTDTSW